MSGLDKITMDGTVYRVRVKFGTLGRSFRIPDGENAGELLSGRDARDVIGTYYDYTMSVEPDPRYPEDYDAFYNAISAPVDSHEIKMPYGQTTVTFQAMVTGGSDMSQGVLGGVQRWSGLKISFTAIAPARTPTT